MAYLANILVVDDEKGTLDTLVGVLEGEGHRAVGFQSGAEAIRSLVAEEASADIDIVISDLKLPDMSGLEILMALKKIKPDAAFILMTGYATVETAIEAVNKGAFTYHMKPLDLDALGNSIRNAVRHQELLAENKKLLDRLQRMNKELTISNRELQNAAERVRLSEIKYRTVVEQAGDGIFIVDPENGNFVEVNPRMEALTGYCREELLNLIMPMLHPESEQTAGMGLLGRTLEHGHGGADYLSFQQKNGDRIPVDLNTNLVEYEGRSVVLGIARDVTERKTVEERVRETSRLVSVGDLAAGVAHEINNPLTIILGFSQLLMARELPDQVGSHVERIYTEAQRAAKIVQNLISFAWRRRPEKQYMDVTAVLQRALELKSYDFKVNNIEVSALWDRDLPLTMVDEYQMTQSIINIMNNAEQAMYEAHQGGRLTIRASRSDDRIKVTIADDGPGILVEHLRKIFDPFFTTREVGSGTGLGLSICYGVIRQHGGTIWAESVPDGGTTVCITLPISRARSWEDSESGEEFVSTKHLLVVEDEPHLRDLLADALAIERYMVDMAEDELEARRKLGKHPYDCVVLDLKASKDGGWRRCRLIEDCDRDMAGRVIFVAGNEDGAWAEATGNPMVREPFSIEELRRQILGPREMAPAYR